MSNGNRPSRSTSSFHFFAGLGSGVLSAVLLQPADLLKTRVQQSKSSNLLTVLRAISNGPNPARELWRGTLPSALRTGFGSALYFSTLNALRQSVATANHSTTASKTSRNNASSSSLPKLSNLANMATGAIARASAGFIMMPITVIKVRFESNYYNYTSIFSAGTDIFRTSGFRGFFAGFGATAVRDAPYAGLYLLFYEQSKKRLSQFTSKLSEKTEKVIAKEKHDKLSAKTAASINFVSGLTAAGLGTAITNPFDAIKTRLQLMPEKYRNMVVAARLMLREEGVRSLFHGLGLRIGRKAMSSALAWTLYEELIRRAEVRWRERAGMV